MVVDTTALGRSRLVGIEGLRGIAASSILVYHVWLYGAPGAHSVALPASLLTKLCANLIAGVTLFFVLSGFLLYRPFARALLTGGPRPSVREYFRNRTLRILPAYWTILLVVACAFHRELLRAPAQLLANALFLQDYVPRYMPTGNGGAGIVPAWSLCVEVVFYLLLPVLAVLASRLFRARGIVSAAAPVALLLVLGLASKGLERSLHLGNVWQSAFPIRADWFAVGMAVAILRVLWEGGRLRRPAPRSFALILLSAIAVAGIGIELYDGGVLSATEYQTPIAVACGALLAYLVLGGAHTRLARLLSRRPLVVAGLASYSVFLWHDPILRTLRGNGWTAAGSNGFLLNVVLLGFVVGTLSTLSYRWIERPPLRLKRRASVAPQPAEQVVQPRPAEAVAAPSLR